MAWFCLKSGGRYTNKQETLDNYTETESIADPKTSRNSGLCYVLELQEWPINREAPRKLLERRGHGRSDRGQGQRDVSLTGAT